MDRINDYVDQPLSNLIILDFIIAKVFKDACKRTVSLSYEEIKKELGAKDTHFREKLNNIATFCDGFRILIGGKEVHPITHFSLSGDVLSVEINKVCSDFLSDSYLQIAKEGISKTLSNKYTYMLYSILKHDFIEKPSESEIKYDLYLLMNRMGMTLIENVTSPVNKAYERFGNFNTKILTPAISEINEKTDIKVDMSFIKDAVKVVSIVFSRKDFNEKTGGRFSAYYVDYDIMILTKAMPEWTLVELKDEYKRCRGDKNLIFEAYIRYMQKHMQENNQKSEEAGTGPEKKKT